DGVHRERPAVEDAEAGPDGSLAVTEDIISQTNAGRELDGRVVEQRVFRRLDSGERQAVSRVRGGIESSLLSVRIDLARHGVDGGLIRGGAAHAAANRHGAGGIQ